MSPHGVALSSDYRDCCVYIQRCFSSLSGLVFFNIMMTTSKQHSRKMQSEFYITLLSIHYHNYSLWLLWLHTDLAPPATYYSSSSNQLSTAISQIPSSRDPSPYSPTHPTTTHHPQTHIPNIPLHLLYPKTLSHSNGQSHRPSSMRSPTPTLS